MYPRISLGFAAAALLAACPENDGATARQVADAGTDGSAENGSCEPEEIEAFPAGEPSWSGEDLAACTAACPEADAACRRRHCPGSEEHDECVLDSFDACLTQPDAPCREAWEAYSCCSSSCDDGQVSDAALRRCIEHDCQTELGIYADCADAALEVEDPCLDEAETSCILP